MDPKVKPATSKAHLGIKLWPHTQKRKKNTHAQFLYYYRKVIQFQCLDIRFRARIYPEGSDAKWMKNRIKLEKRAL